MTATNTAKYATLLGWIHVEHMLKKAQLGLQLLSVNLQLMRCNFRIFLYS